MVGGAPSASTNTSWIIKRVWIFISLLEYYMRIPMRLLTDDTHTHTPFGDTAAERQRCTVRKNMECCSWSTFKQMQRGSKNAQTHVHKHTPPGYLIPRLTSLKTNFPLEAPDWCFCLACTDASVQGLSSIFNKCIKLQLNERRFPSAVNWKHPCRLAVRRCHQNEITSRISQGADCVITATGGMLRFTLIF